MKKIIWIIAGVLVLCLLIGVYFWFAHRKINAKQVEKIQLGNASTAPVLNAEETAKFIELFNSASYAGEGTGEGGTPDWTVCVRFRNGSCMYISEFGKAGSKCEVTLRNYAGGKTAWFYVNSAQLRTFILEMIDKY